MRKALRLIPRTGPRVALGLTILFFLAGTAGATHEPADKVEAVASNVEVMQTQGGPGSSSSEVALLRGTLRTSSPTDLQITVTNFSRARQFEHKLAALPQPVPAA